MLPMREQSYAKVDHPDPLLTSDGRGLIRIDDPIVDRLQKGDTVFGWVGDARLALYLDADARMWELWRLEADNVYRRTTSVPADAMRGPEVVGYFVTKLVECDRNRGFDVGSTVEKINVARAKERDDAATAFNEEWAGRLASALKKDGVH